MLVTSALNSIALMGVCHRFFCRPWDTELSNRPLPIPMPSSALGRNLDFAAAVVSLLAVKTLTLMDPKHATDTRNANRRPPGQPRTRRPAVTATVSLDPISAQGMIM